MHIFQSRWLPLKAPLLTVHFPFGPKLSTAVAGLLIDALGNGSGRLNTLLRNALHNSQSTPGDIRLHATQWITYLKRSLGQIDRQQNRVRLNGQ